MPRKPRDTTRPGPALPPDDDTPDTGAAAQQRVVRTAAGAAPFPAAPGTRRSAFETVPAPLVAGPVIHRQLPIPEPRTGRASRYLQDYEALQVGDCAEYPNRQAVGMAQALRKAGLPHVVRSLSPTTKGVWRIAGVVAGTNATTKTRKAS